MVEHECRRIKRAYRFGRKQKPDLYCKDCGRVVKRRERRKKEVKKHDRIPRRRSK